MHILLDFTQIPLQRTGVGVYADHLVNRLPALLGPGDQLSILVQDDESSLDALPLRYSNTHLLKISAERYRRRAMLLLYEQVMLPRLITRFRIDVLHSLHYTFPLMANCRRAVTIHDLTFDLFPDLHTRGRRLLFPFFIRQALRRAECPLYVSHSTLQDAERLYGASRHAGRVTYLGVEVPSPLLAEFARTRLEELGIQQPFLLFVGTLEPRKNVVRLIRAFEMIAAAYPDLSLVLAGKPGWHTESTLEALERSPVRSRIVRTGYIREDQKTSLLQGCAAMVYPSLYEGFGLPVLEAMAYGAPVITSNVSAMPEVSGDAAVLVDPESPEKIAEAIRLLLEEDPEASARRRARSLERARVFTWASCAAQTFAGYCASPVDAVGDSVVVEPG